MSWIRKHYNVPAKRGGRVEYTGDGRAKFGTITSANGGLLRIRLDGLDYSSSYHPTWELRYLDAAQAQAKGE